MSFDLVLAKNAVPEVRETHHPFCGNTEPIAAFERRAMSLQLLDNPGPSED